MTGVQTCALPIYGVGHPRLVGQDQLGGQGHAHGFFRRYVEGFVIAADVQRLGPSQDGREGLQT